MKLKFYSYILVTAILVTNISVIAQTLPPTQWRLTNVVYNNSDPDGGNPATGSVQFTLQVKVTQAAVTIPDVTILTTGWAWQSTNAMLPTGPAPIPTCGSVSISQPSNITMSTAFASAGFTYNSVNQCSGSVSFSTGGQSFDRRASGSVDGGTITLTDQWTDVFTVTLWALGNSFPEAGYAVINSGAGGSPGEFTTYVISDINGEESAVSSQTYTTPLPLGEPVVTPVLFTNFSVECSDKGALVKWTTAAEYNNSHYEVQKNTNGSWVTIGTVDADANSTSEKNYQFMDLEGGAAQYRVKQVDIDGTVDYTVIRNTNCRSKDIGVVLYPVPANDKLNVVIKTSIASRTELQIIDMSGRIVKRTSVNLVNGSNNIPINVSDLAKGEYMLISSDKSMQINKKFVIAR